MKINLSDIDREQFIVREDVISGETCSLVFPPHIGTKWSKDNMIFRSSIWNSDGELISASFKKFFNWGEKPELAYTPFSTKANGGIDVITKEDGSTLIVSMYKGQLITRTRGTFCATALDNGNEVAILMNKYPEAFDLEVDENGTCNYSLIFEWVTPNNIIVINYGPEPDIILIGKIYHDTYRLETQKNLDKLAESLGVLRPETHHYDSVKELLEDVEEWVGVEGVCVYSKKGQEIRKVKASQYLALHRMKSELGSFGRVLDVFIEMGMPTYGDFYNQLSEVYDYEIVERCRPHISLLCDAWKEVEKLISGMNNFLETKVKKLTTRKEQAKLILDSYGNTNRAGYLFTLLAGRELEKDNYKKLVYQIVKEPEERELDNDISHV